MMALVLFGLGLASLSVLSAWCGTRKRTRLGYVDLSTWRSNDQALGLFRRRLAAQAVVVLERGARWDEWRALRSLE